MKKKQPPQGEIFDRSTVFGQIAMRVTGTSSSVAEALGIHPYDALDLLKQDAADGALIVDKSKRPHEFRLAPEISEILEVMAIIERTDEIADCMIWNGGVGESGHPIYKPYGGVCTLVRRAMFSFAIGPLEKRKPIDVKCGEKRCVNPAHMVRSSVAEIAKKAAARGAFSSLARRAKIAKSKRKNGKLTEEKAQEIRESSESTKILAERYGVNKSLINGIKLGKFWRDYSPNPWAGLGARSAA